MTTTPKTQIAEFAPIPRSPNELRARLADLILRREALTKHHEERKAAEALRAADLKQPPAPKPARQSRVAEAKMGAGWMEEHDLPWLEIAREDVEALGDVPEHETPKLGRPRKTRVAPDLAAALARISGAADKPARPGYGRRQSDGGVQTPSTLPSLGTEPSPAPPVPGETQPLPPRAPNEAGAAWMNFHGGDWLEEAMALIKGLCYERAAKPDAKVRGRSCDPVQLELPLPPDVQARKDIPHKAPAEPRVSPVPPVRPKDHFEARRARLEALVGPMRLAADAPSFDRFACIAIISPTRAGPEWLPGFEILQSHC